MSRFHNDKNDMLSQVITLQNNRQMNPNGTSAAAGIWFDVNTVCQQHSAKMSRRHASVTYDVWNSERIGIARQHR